MGLDGADSFSVQYQNANNSVRVTDEFMQAVVDDADWELRAVTTGEVLRPVPARASVAGDRPGAWECADPGLQFDTTINRWHTAPNHGRITASNPCFTGDSMVHTDQGLIRFDELFGRANTGEEFRVWTHDVTNPDEPADVMHLTTPEAVMVTGKNPVLRLRFSNGMELRCTPTHRVFTLNRGYVEAQELCADDRVRSLDLAAPRRARRLGDTRRMRTGTSIARRVIVDMPLHLPEVWSDSSPITWAGSSVTVRPRGCRR